MRHSPFPGQEEKDKKRWGVSTKSFVSRDRKNRIVSCLFYVIVIKRAKKEQIGEYIFLVVKSYAAGTFN